MGESPVTVNHRIITCTLMLAFLGPLAPVQSHAESLNAPLLIEEILVTATKTERSLQEVPIAVSAFSATTIEKTRMHDLTDIAMRTPNFMIGEQGPTAPELTIRGIGSTDRESGSDRSVVVFVDEVYIGRTGASTFDLFDLERIEVLRGPQGTLFGRNVVGGAVNLVTAKPSPDFDYKVQVGAGERDLGELRAMVNGALNDTTSGRLSFSMKSQDGFYEQRTFNGRTSNSTDIFAARAQLLYTPSADTSLLLSLDASNDEIDGVASKITQGAASDADFAAALAPFGPFVPDRDPYTTDNNKFGNIERKHVALMARLDWTTALGDVTVIPAWRNAEFDELRDIAGIGFNEAGVRGFESTAINDENYTALSLEARIGNSGEQLRWIAGLYYLDEEIDRDQIRERQANTAYSRPLFDQLNNASSVAVFGEVGYRFIDQAELTLGGRWSDETKDFDMVVVNTLSLAEQQTIAERLGRATTLNPATQVYSASASDSWSEFTPKVTLSYDFSDDLLAFATYSNGFKSGGYVGLAATSQSAQISFAPETATNIEVGIKSTLLDGRLQLNASYYDILFEQLQLRDRLLTIPGDVTSAIVTITNAAEAEMSGFELEVVALPAPGLTLSGSYASLDSEITKVNPNSTVVLGTSLPRAPESTWNLSAEYEYDFLGGYLSLRADYRHTGDHYFDLNEQQAGFESGYGLLGARIAYATGAWEIALWGKNLRDEVYRTHVQSIRAGRAGVSQIGSPRTWGITFTMQPNG